MRITGGIYVGKRIVCPPGEIRPAMDRMRESLFSILQNLEGNSFLDLFSGSGIVGIEAASRGADPVHLVEMDKGKQETIQKNISFVAGTMKIHMIRAEKFLKNNTRQFDIVYADPPFPMEGKENFSALVDKYHTVAPGGLYIIHIPTEENPQWFSQLGELQLYDTRKYGRSILRFYRREAAVLN